MKNFVQDGDVVTVPAPAAVASGDGVLVGTLFGFATSAAASGADVEIITEGVFNVVKATGQVWAVGAAIYWDNAAKNFTTTSASNTLVGKVLVGAASGDVTGRVRLSGF